MTRASNPPVPEAERDSTWRWDPSLYAGSAAYYSRGRVPYPPSLAAVLVDALGLDGQGRLLDLGCGPGSLTLLLSPYFAQVVAVDADEQMLQEGARRAREADVDNVAWVHARAEDLSPADGEFRLATLAQSFHWMDRDHVAGLLRHLLPAGSTLAFLHATTHQGIAGVEPLPHPRPPRAALDALVGEYLGPRRRAGRGHRQSDTVEESERGTVEAEILGRAGFAEPRRLVVPSWTVTRSADEVVASVFSLSYAAPHLFGDEVDAFESSVRALLTEVSPSGWFSEVIREVAVDLWSG